MRRPTAIPTQRSSSQQKKTEEQLTIFFQNKGETIPDEKLALLFDKFYRLDVSRISDTGGTGLGLAIAKEIVSLHGGRICAASENEVNTFFCRAPPLLRIFLGKKQFHLKTYNAPVPYNNGDRGVYDCTLYIMKGVFDMKANMKKEKSTI